VDRFQVQKDSCRRSMTLVLLLFFYGFLGWSVIFSANNVSVRVVEVLVALAVVFLATTLHRTPRQWMIISVVFLLITTLISALYWWSVSLALFNLHLVIALLLLSYSTPAEIDKLIDIASWFVAFVLLGGFVALTFSIWGAAPVGAFPRPGSEFQEMVIYPFSLALADLGGGIRPSGIYDEPGALSFVVCVLAFLRKVRNKDFFMTWLILGLGLITFSLAHLVFIIIFVLSFRLRVKDYIVFAFIGSVLAGVYVFTPIGGAFDQRVVERIISDNVEEGRLFRGDNRSVRLLSAFETIGSSDYSAMMGIDPKGSAEEFAEMGENVLAPIARYGIIVSLPYYAYLIIGIIMLFKGRDNLAFFGVVLLLLQRPYVQSYGYSLLVMLALWAQLNGSIARPCGSRSG